MTLKLSLKIVRRMMSFGASQRTAWVGRKGNGLRQWVIAGCVFAVIACSGPLLAQRNGGDPDSAAAAKASGNFDPHNLNGSWIGTKGIYGDDNAIPEPPLTEWAKEHLLMKNISHAGLNAIAKGAPSAGSLADGVKSFEQNGVPSNVPEGHYPGEYCEPQGIPVTFNFINAYPMLFIVLPDRIYQMFEDHREWRTIWLDRKHPNDLLPSYFGDSIGAWEGNTLVVDTIGFNGEKGHRWISENVGHYMSDAFRLIERYRLTDSTHLELEMTYYDPKAWGDKPWAGFKKSFKLDSKGDSLQENVCDPARAYDDIIEHPAGLPSKPTE
jgi:hypothetical protein